jgi:hypothetical protein
MKFISFFILFIQSAIAIDFGTGADGACVLSGVIVNQTYNCTSLTIPAGTHTIATGTVVTIKVQGDVSIVGILNLNGGIGANGGNGASLAGVAGQPGGFAGGGCAAAGGCTLQHGLSNDTTSGGRGGTLGADNGTFANAGGGGGSGGNHNTNSQATAGISGTDGGGGATFGPGGAIPSTSYGSELLFERIMIGGSGGGAGGTGDSGGSTRSGGAGGGGGGAIKIIADGDIIISGSIQANGGNGGNGLGAAGSGPSAGGGGGSGGAIWLYSTGDISLNSSTTLQVSGGTGGAGSVEIGPLIGGAGGNGGQGRIRLDDFDGSITNAPSFAVINSNGQFLYESEISPGCGTIEDINNKPPQSGAPFIILFCLLLLLNWQQSRRSGSFVVSDIKDIPIS